MANRKKDRLKDTLNKKDGVIKCAEMLMDGKETAEILRTIAEICGKSTSAIEKWMKEARIIVSDRQKEAEQIRINETTAAISEAVKGGLKSDLEIEHRLCLLAFGDLDIEETTVSEQFGVTTFKRKPTPAEQVAAVKEIWKKRGSYAPSKIAQTDTKGNDVTPTVIKWGDKQITV